MHPKLTRKVVELFHSETTNPRHAQLVFVTHDSNLFDARLLRRDQIAFTKKDAHGATELYTLVEYKGVRNDASFEKDYLLGKYDAIPENLNVLEDVFRKPNYRRFPTHPRPLPFKGRGALYTENECINTISCKGLRV